MTASQSPPRSMSDEMDSGGSGSASTNHETVMGNDDSWRDEEDMNRLFRPLTLSVQGIMALDLKGS